DENGELLTEQNLWKPSIYPAKEPLATIMDFEVVDLDKDGRLEIVVMLRGLEWYPSRLAILHYEDLNFKEVNTFWNPGHLNWLVIDDIDGDGFAEIICGGYNNDLKRVPAFRISENVRSLFMLQGRAIFGQAPPYLGNAEKGSQVWYRYITPGWRSEASLITGLDVIGKPEKRILVKLNDTCFFYLNYAGEIVDRFYGDLCKGETKMHLIANEKTRP
ncbi:MAG: FG-GAP repeat domain-containing protein, partial [bacterium]